MTTPKPPRSSKSTRSTSTRTRAASGSEPQASPPSTSTRRSSKARPAVPAPTPHAPIGRIPVIDVRPSVENGRWPIKAVVGEAFPIRATVFREGHDAVAATAVLIAPDGSVHSTSRMRDVAPGLDLHQGWLRPDALGTWSYRVEGWSDPWGTWLHDATLKVPAGVDVELMLGDGAALLERAAATIETIPPASRAILLSAAHALRDGERYPAARLAAGLTAPVREIMDAHPIRELVSPSADFPLVVHRELALFGSWYEMFPRSEGATQDAESGQWTSGTLRAAAERLPQIAAMGFDVVYLTPIHPIGLTNRKGRNNTLTTEPGDPGSPYGIGSPDGGHDAIHPELGTFADFDDFVAQARAVGIEVALDLALQASPDHPWVAEHPEWFSTRSDGTIAYAENPPKKYQDIYPLNFDNDPEGIYAAILDVVRTWIDHGVTAFRVDNPHTKPLPFWERLLAEVAATRPDVLFLSEAFTRPAMMHTLAAIGFHQSYTYFTWRHSKDELASYFSELAGDSGAVMRPSLWPTTHDILTPYMQAGGEAAFAIRAVLAATGAPTWGIYSGYELVESVARPGAQEQIDNEKYEFKPRDWAVASHTPMATLLGQLNRIRRRHPALQRLRNIWIHPTSDDATFAFSRFVSAEHSPSGQADAVIVIVNLDPHSTRESAVHLNLEALGIEHARGLPDAFVAHDLLTGMTYPWGSEVFVRLDPRVQVAHVMHVQPL